VGAGDEIDVDCTGGTIALPGYQNLDQPGVKIFTLWTNFIIFLPDRRGRDMPPTIFSSARSKLKHPPVVNHEKLQRRLGLKTEDRGKQAV